MPTPGSDVWTIFDADLGAANGGQAVVYATSVVTVGEDDHTAITGSDSPESVILRDRDVAATSTWLPGSALNWVHALFIGPTSLAIAPAFRQLLPAAGLTANYADLGDAHQ